VKRATQTNTDLEQSNVAIEFRNRVAFAFAGVVLQACAQLKEFLLSVFTDLAVRVQDGAHIVTVCGTQEVVMRHFLEAIPESFVQFFGTTDLSSEGRHPLTCASIIYAF
jgi:hypothetical protein